jgi:hypothetical protein
LKERDDGEEGYGTRSSRKRENLAKSQIAMFESFEIIFIKVSKAGSPVVVY